MTACFGLLKWLVDKINTEGENSARSPTGTIPLKALDFAIRRCSDYIGAQSHEDIDQETERVWSHQWDQFICWYYKIIQNQALFVCNNVPFQVSSYESFIFLYSFTFFISSKKINIYRYLYMYIFFFNK